MYVFRVDPWKIQENFVENEGNNNRVKEPELSALSLLSYKKKMNSLFWDLVCDRAYQ